MSPRNSVHTRPATVSDRGAITELLAEASLPTVGVEQILNSHADDFTVAIDADGIVIGVSGLEIAGDSALLRSVAVRAAARGQGVAGQLVNESIASAKSRGIHTLYLLTTTAPDFFPKFGFARCDRTDAPPAIAATEEFTSACPASAIAMRRVLT